MSAGSSTVERATDDTGDGLIDDAELGGVAAGNDDAVPPSVQRLCERAAEAAAAAGD
jgi:hypothetical protein